MCGIAGCYNIEDAYRRVQLMLAAQVHRGPDAMGQIMKKNASLGMVHLNIRNGKSIPIPIITEKANNILAYNGEIYSSLKCDKVIVDCNDELTELSDSLTGFKHCDGMYALASLTNNENNQELNLVRDHYGIKPLFFKETNRNGITFASEIFPLLLQDDHHQILNEQTVLECLIFGVPLDNKTIFEGLHMLDPRYLHVYSKSDKKKKLLSSEDEFIHNIRGSNSSINAKQLKQALFESVSNCLSTNENVGLAISGGLDSTLFAHVLNEFGFKKLTTFSVHSEGIVDGIRSLSELGFKDGGAWKSWEHECIQITPFEYMKLLDESILVYCQPHMMSSVPFWLKIGEACHNKGIKVLLTGEGADELFYGYSSYFNFAKLKSQINVFEELVDFYLPRSFRHIQIELFGENKVNNVIDKFRSCFSPFGNNLGSKLRNVELSLSLRPLLQRLDACLMRYAVEGRTPFLHGNIPKIANAFGISEAMDINGGKKPLYNLLPPHIEPKAKMPFRAPIQKLLCSSFSEQIKAEIFLRKKYLKRIGISESCINQLFSHFNDNESRSSRLIFAIYTFAKLLSELELKKIYVN